MKNGKRMGVITQSCLCQLVIRLQCAVVNLNVCNCDVFLSLVVLRTTFFFAYTEVPECHFLKVPLQSD